MLVTVIYRFSKFMSKTHMLLFISNIRVLGNYILINL